MTTTLMISPADETPQEPGDPRPDMLDIAFVAENVGEWMFHCHILDHSAGGMMGTIVVE